MSVEPLNELVLFVYEALRNSIVCVCVLGMLVIMYVIKGITILSKQVRECCHESRDVIKKEILHGCGLRVGQCKRYQKLEHTHRLGYLDRFYSDVDWSDLCIVIGLARAGIRVVVWETAKFPVSQYCCLGPESLFREQSVW